MPVVTAVVGADCLPQKCDVIEQFVLRTAGLCQEILAAAPDKIEISVVSSLTPLYGEKILIEVRYRDGEHRTAEVMNRYMAELDACCMQSFAARPRIRCYPLQSSQIFARN